MSRIPLSAAHFDVEGVDDTGFVGGIEVFPHYRINQYIAWGLRFAHNTSHSDFPIFDESMTNVNFETMAESSTAYGMNWSGRLSIGRYFPSNDVNDDAFWLLRGGLGLHYHLHDNFTMLPFSATTTPLKAELTLPETEAFSTKAGWSLVLNFSSCPTVLGTLASVSPVSGITRLLKKSMEFYFNMKGNF